MCMFNQPDIPAPAEVAAVPERAAARAPDQAATKTAVGRRTSDRVRAGAGTILTSGSGVTATADTAKKTLLGA